jgi:hypothetical protein
MRRTLPLLITSVIVLLGRTQAFGAEGSRAGELAKDKICTADTLHGAYGIQFQGTRPALPPAPPGTVESFLGIGVRTYDGEGQFTQVSTVKGVVSGVAYDAQSTGTYVVNEDCTGSHTLQNPGAPPSTDRFVIVDDGHEVRTTVVTPPPVFALATLLKIHAGPGQSGKHRECSQETLKGTYGIQIQGTGPAGPGGPTESIIGVVIRTYDGEGQFRQIDNVRGSISGIVLDRPGSGTYEVDADCTAVVRFQPAPGIVLEERMVIVDDGNETRSGTVLPLPNVVTAIHRRTDVR